MTDKQTYWLVDGDGAKALVVGVDERDRFRPHGWTETTEPAGSDMVWLEHEVTGGRQLFPMAVTPQWGALGWRLAGPPEPVDLTKDPQVVDQPLTPPAAQPVVVEAADEPKAPPTDAASSSKATQKTRAASGDEKE